MTMFAPSTGVDQLAYLMKMNVEHVFSQLYR